MAGKMGGGKQRIDRSPVHMTVDQGTSHHLEMRGFTKDGDPCGLVHGLLIRSSDNHTVQVYDREGGHAKFTAVGQPGHSASITIVRADDPETVLDQIDVYIAIPPVVESVQLEIVDIPTEN